MYGAAPASFTCRFICAALDPRVAAAVAVHAAEECMSWFLGKPFAGPQEITIATRPC